jgi:hypothetical protein
MDISSAFASLSAIEKIVPVLEAIGKEVGPLIQEEVDDGKVLWGDLVKCFEDLKGAIAAVKSAAEPKA